MTSAKFAIAVSALFLSTTAQAELQDRGGGLLYDDVLKITWLQDANYAKSSGYDSDGLMNWADANSWAANLVYHDSARGIDWSDWRLPKNSPVGTAWTFGAALDGSSDVGYNITSPNAELAYMYHVALGLKNYYSPAGIFQPDFGIFGNGTTSGEVDVGPVKNLQSYAYWYRTAALPPPPDAAWDFNFMHGGQVTGNQALEMYAWAVRDGDVAAVPEPEFYALFLTGLGLLGVATRRKAKLRS